MNYSRELTQVEKQVFREKCRTIQKYCTKVYCTVTAASKMLNHGHFGQPKEVMGLLQGSYYDQNGKGVFVVTDIICLPVEASETRVTADGETYSIIAQYSEWIGKINTYNIVGWYHSHPSYGCWLSGIDVATQERFQTEDPFLAIVVDPIKSVNLQKVDIGAFRVYNKGHKEPTATVKDVPRRKAVDFGYHSQRYYQLSVQLITNESGKSTLRSLESMQWSSSLSSASFTEQLPYLTQEVLDEKLDLQEYLEVKESPTTKQDQVRDKERSTLKKVACYSKERNLSLLDASIQNALF